MNEYSHQSDVGQVTKCGRSFHSTTHACVRTPFSFPLSCLISECELLLKVAGEKTCSVSYGSGLQTYVFRDVPVRIEVEARP